MRGLSGIGINGIVKLGVVFNAIESVSRGNGSLDAWVTDQLWVNSVAPKTGNTGDLNIWVTDQLWINGYGAV